MFRDKHSFLLTIFFAVAGCLIGLSASAQRPEPEKTDVRGHTMYTLMEPGDIPAISEPEFVAVSEADSVYYDNEPLIAVIYGDTAKGYSIWHLDRHEIVNDYISGRAITVTW